ncbi:hypothetical protein [Arenibacter sp. F20364]|uniref:hypothetical protein n=1 Tax=Arenibacter sp. F20364 TaxID=2926415 RepID=UPI001FF3F01F|nr:hypothetical protein [Arenibacter sp. F20364]MCK0191109.1 hypothetical protein [Arenibacter sp. F20364]
MNIPKIHTSLLWDLTTLFVLLTLMYLTILFLLRSSTLIKRNNKEAKMKQIRGIICELLLYDQGNIKGKKRELIDLKVELWKLLHRTDNQQIMSNILLEMYIDFDDGTRQIIHKMSKEFGLQIDAFENSEHLDAQTTENSTMLKHNKDVNDNLKDLESIMEQPKNNRPLDSNSQNASIKPDSLREEELDLDFIPLVTNNEDPNEGSSPEIQEVLMITNDLEFLRACLGMEGFERNPYEAIYEEIYGENDMLSPNNPQKKEASFLNIDFLPLILEIEEIKSESDPIINPNDFEVDYEVVLDPYMKKQISDILKSHVEEESRAEAIGKDENLLDLGEMKLPAAKFYTDWESKKVKLLHSIAEMGDIREVPLLNEMLDEEENESIANLIKEIILKFLFEYPMDIDEEDVDNNIVDFGEHYVFNHLFNSLDRESQLLLLQEMQQVGDLSDLYFLETLHNHTDKVIGEKAMLVSLYIEAKLQKLSTDGMLSPSNHNAELKKAINKPQKLHLDPSVTFEKAKSNFAPKAPSNRRTPENDRAASSDPKFTPIDIEEETFDYNDLFEIDFDITTSEHITFYNSSSYKSEKNLGELEEINFLDQLKDLTNKIFRK